MAVLYHSSSSFILLLHFLFSRFEGGLNYQFKAFSTGGSIGAESYALGRQQGSNNARVINTSTNKNTRASLSTWDSRILNVFFCVKARMRKELSFHGSGQHAADEVALQ